MKLNAYTYSFPFKEPFQTSAAFFEERKGLVLELNAGEITALGEAAPLPGFSAETLDEVVQQLKTFTAEIIEQFQNDLSLDALQVFHRKKNIYPSLQFALDTLAVDFLSQQLRTTPQDFLFDDYSEELQVNGILPITKDGNTFESIEKLVEEGYSTVKIKIGKAFEHELEELRRIRSLYPSLKLRLDANKAWEVDEAVRNLSKLDSLDIEYCEEPLAQATVENYKKLQKKIRVPLALDESLIKIRDLESIMQVITVVVIKPMVLGSLTKLFATNRHANDHGNKVIYTTSLESGIGRTMTVILAAGLGSRNSAHGLSTGSLLTMDVWNDGTYINNGSVSLPDRSELGQRYHSNHKYLEPGRIDL